MIKKRRDSSKRMSLIEKDTFSAPSGATITTGSGGGGGLSTSDKIAIGVGVPSGIAAVAAAIIAWYECCHKGRCRKSKKSMKTQRPTGSINSPATHVAPSFIVPTPAMAELD
jgi:hypothetical protein